MQKAQHHRDSGNNAWNALRVAAQPSVLTVSGRTGDRPGVPAIARHTVGSREMSVIG